MSPLRSSREDVVVLIPAYRPDERLSSLVDELRARGFRDLVVVDDGGGPDYADIFASLEGHCDVLRHAVNLGKGRALKTGLNHCAVHYGERAGVVTVDADGQHAPDDVVSVATALVENRGTVVLGNRRFEGDVPLRSRLGNEMTRLVFRVMVGMSLTDTQSGLRGIPMTHVAPLIPLSGERYEYETNMLLELHRRRLGITEIPIRTIYINDNEASHFNPILDSFAIYFLLLRFVFSSFASAVLDTAVFYVAYRSLGDLATSVVIARTTSSIFNFALNRGFVFQSDRSIATSIALYYLLVGVVGLLSYGSIRLLHEGMDVPVFASKILSDTLLFLLSFLTQRDFIFKRPEASGA